MSKINRSDIKNLFLKGKMPKENDFHDLIDSTINSIDDGIIKEKGKGFKILSSGPNKEIMSFYDNIKDLTPTWEVNQISDDGDEGFNIQEANGGSRFFIKKGGDIGLGTSTPSSKLDVKGITKDDLLSRFGDGHGMVKIGGEVLDMFNKALPSIKGDLEKLGAYDDPNILFNMELVIPALKPISKNSLGLYFLFNDLIQSISPANS